MSKLTHARSHDAPTLTHAHQVTGHEQTQTFTDEGRPTARVSYVNKHINMPVDRHTSGDDYSWEETLLLSGK